MIKHTPWVVLIAVAMLTACSAKPAPEDLKAMLLEHMPDKVRTVSALEQIQTEISAEGDGVTAKFKAQLRATQPLYVPVDFGKVVAPADVATFDSVQNVARGLSPGRSQQFSAEVERLAARPVFLQEVVAAGSIADWYGSFKVRKVVDKWVTSDFRTDIEPGFKGMPRASFANTAILLENAPQWLAEVRKEQLALGQRLTDAQTLDKTEVQLAETQAAAQREIQQTQAAAQRDILQAQATAQRERQLRENVVTAVEKQARQMPIQYTFRRATLGNSLVLQMQADSPMTVRMDVTRGLQRFSRDVQLQPGRTLNFGHVEGWGFKSGDHVNLTNSAFDAVGFAAP